MGFFDEASEKIDNMSDEEFMEALRKAGLEDCLSKIKYTRGEKMSHTRNESGKIKGELTINGRSVYYDGEPLIAEIEGEFNGNSLKEDLLQVLDKHDYAYENAKRYAIFIRKNKDKPEIKVDF